MELDLCIVTFLSLIIPVDVDGEEIDCTGGSGAEG